MAADDPGRPVASIVTMDGLKFRVLAVPLRPGLDAGDIEVSSDLTDWSSGARHTVEISGRDGYLTVRDRTPLLPGTKRFIRLKSR